MGAEPEVQPGEADAGAGAGAGTGAGPITPDGIIAAVGKVAIVDKGVEPQAVQVTIADVHPCGT